jgi:hypothetical protein
MLQLISALILSVAAASRNVTAMPSFLAVGPSAATAGSFDFCAQQKEQSVRPNQRT